MKKRLIAIAVIAAVIFGVASAGHQPTTTNLTTTPSSSQTAGSEDTLDASPAKSATQTDTSPEPANTPSSPTTENDNLSNDNTYTNVDGNAVHSPAYSSDDSIPAGATAKCVDGTYSFSQHHRGTCSYHGGVASWL